MADAAQAQDVEPEEANEDGETDGAESEVERASKKTKGT